MCLRLWHGVRVQVLTTGKTMTRLTADRTSGSVLRSNMAAGERLSIRADPEWKAGCRVTTERSLRCASAGHVVGTSWLWPEVSKIGSLGRNRAFTYVYLIIDWFNLYLLSASKIGSLEKKSFYLRFFNNRLV